MRAIVLASLLSVSCSFIVRGTVDKCDPQPASCDGNILVTCSDAGLFIRTDCGQLTCNETLESCDNCGNGAVDAGEECDDGNDTQGDNCENNCTLPRCGNGIIDNVDTVDLDGDGQPDSPEQCDNAGENSDDLADACRTNCQSATCGDGTIDTNEECDDGDQNADSPNKCRSNCVNPFCGDGIVDFDDIDGEGDFDIGDGEACDDGNFIDDDGCNLNPDTQAPVDPFNEFPCNKTFPGCNNDLARETNTNGDHELCYDDFQTQLSLGNAAGAQAIVARDFDGNEPKNDAIVVKGNQDSIAVFLNDGSILGNLVFEADISVNPAAVGGQGVGIDPIGIATADFDGDSRFDIVTANQGSGNVSILLNRTVQQFTIDFTDPVVLTSGTGPVAVAAGDINGDGLADIVTANPGASEVNIRAGNGDGTFSNNLISVSVGTAKKPVSVVIADIDGDIDNDIITANQDGNDLTILRNNNGNFAPQFVNAGLEPLAVAAADMEGDGDIDLVAANSGDDTVSILLSDGSAQLNFVETTENTEQKPTALFVGDLNHDDQGQTPLLEIIVVNEVSNTITILRAKESAPGTFAPPLEIRVGQKPVAIASTDFDFNTYFDIAVVNTTSNSMSVIYFTP